MTNLSLFSQTTIVGKQDFGVVTIHSYVHQSSQVTALVSQLSPAWADQSLLDFVEKAQDRGDVIL